MELIIKIPNSTFTDLKKKQNRTEVDVAVLNGTPLPKGHGDLIDRQELLKITLCKTFGLRSVDIENAPTIIEADRGDEE